MRGTCEKCGKGISPARLAAIPNATLCLRCQARCDVRLLRAEDVADALAEPGELTPGEAQRMVQRGGG